jgi:aminopeptidase N
MSSTGTEETLAGRSPTSDTSNTAPIPSLLRGFSAPVLLDAPLTAADRLVLLAHDSDPFNRWEAGRSLMRETLSQSSPTAPRPTPRSSRRSTAWRATTALDPAFRALALALPSEDDLAQAMVDAGLVPDPTAIHTARLSVQTKMAAALAPRSRALRQPRPRPRVQPRRRPGRRAVPAQHLPGPLSRIEGPDRARAQFDAAGNMTDQIAAFTTLLDQGDPDIAQAFFDQWQDDRLVMDKWFMAQVAHAAPKDAVATARLTEHPLFDWKNPNRFRSVIGGLTAGNPAGFHDPSGAGYRFLADWIIRLDAKNPQTAARMSTAFETRKRYDADRVALMDAELARIAATEGLSRDVTEMITRMRS